MPPNKSGVWYLNFTCESVNMTQHLSFVTRVGTLCILVRFGLVCFETAINAERDAGVLIAVVAVLTAL